MSQTDPAFHSTSTPLHHPPSAAAGRLCSRSADSDLPVPSADSIGISVLVPASVEAAPGLGDEARRSANDVVSSPAISGLTEPGSRLNNLKTIGSTLTTRDPDRDGWGVGGTVYSGSEGMVGVTGSTGCIEGDLGMPRAGSSSELGLG